MGFKKLLIFLTVFSALSYSAVFGASHFVAGMNGHDLTQMPPYLWYAGCVPTSIGMVMAYWDNYGETGGGTYGKNINYGKLVDYYLDKTAMLTLLSKGGGVFSWSYYGEVIKPKIIYDLAYAMNTTSGGTTIYGAPGVTVVAAARGYTNPELWSNPQMGSTTNDWCWPAAVNEIDNGRPLVWGANASGTGHAIAVWGYTDEKYIIVYNTWDEMQHDFFYRCYNGTTGTPSTNTHITTVEPQGGMDSDCELIYPDGGEYWISNNNYDVQWIQYGTGISKVKILYSVNGGQNWTPLVTAPSAQGDNSYTWIVPSSISSSRVRMRIEGWDAGLATHYGDDGSRMNYTIGAMSPTITPTFTITRTHTVSPTITKTHTNSPTYTATRTASPTFTATRTITKTRTQTGTKTESATFTATRTVTDTFTATPTRTATRTFTETRTFTPTRTKTATKTVTPTFTDTRTYTPTATQTSTKTSTPTATESKTFTNSPTPSVTRTITLTFTKTRTPTESKTFTVTKTFTFTKTFTITKTLSVTPTHTNTVFETATITQTSDINFSPTFTWTQTAILSATDTPKITDTQTPEDTFTMTSSVTFTQTPRDTWTNTPSTTNTATYTNTSTASFTSTSTPTNVVSMTSTRTIVFSPTVTPSYTPTEVMLLPTATLTPAATEMDLKVTGVITYPNPYEIMTGDSLKIRFSLNKNSWNIKVKIYTVSFRLIKDILLDSYAGTGTNETEIDSQKLNGISKGLYYCVIIAEDENAKTVKSRISTVLLY